MRECLRDYVPIQIRDIPHFAKRKGPQVHVTESYVTITGAGWGPAHVTDEVGNRFCLGFYGSPRWMSPVGDPAWNVLMNGMETGESASHIEKRPNGIYIYTREGFKRWSGRYFV